MTSDARITSSSDSAESQNSEPNSLREVLLFCTVLLVEVYSLAVSFGGPFFEVGYFLLVVVSQTFAGIRQLSTSDQPHLPKLKVEISPSASLKFSTADANIRAPSSAVA